MFLTYDPSSVSTCTDADSPAEDFQYFWFLISLNCHLAQQVHAQHQAPIYTNPTYLILLSINLLPLPPRFNLHIQPLTYTLEVFKSGMQQETGAPWRNPQKPRRKCKVHMDSNRGPDWKWVIGAVRQLCPTIWATLLPTLGRTTLHQHNFRLSCPWKGAVFMALTF